MTSVDPNGQGPAFYVDAVPIFSVRVADGAQETRGLAPGIYSIAVRQLTAGGGSVSNPRIADATTVVEANSINIGGRTLALEFTSGNVAFLVRPGTAPAAGAIFWVYRTRPFRAEDLLRPPDEVLVSHAWGRTAELISRRAGKWARNPRN